MNPKADSGRDQVAELSPLGERRMKFTYASGDRPLEGYTVKRGIGCGGFGEVYYAVSDGGKEVAMKLVQRHLDIEMRGVSQCLNLKHPNLVILYDVKQTGEGENWVVMEYMSGESLDELIGRNPVGMAPEEVLRLLRGIADGVGYLHDHGIVHRDLKPGNIFIENGVVKIGDYGLAKYISASRRSGQTESVGTVHYMAPEVARGRYGKEIDLYALGVIIYEMLTGRVPFAGESPGEILMKHLTAEADLSVLAEPFRSVVGRLIAKTPEDRYAGAAAMVSDLADRLAGRVPPDPQVARFAAAGVPPFVPPPPPGAAAAGFGAHARAGTRPRTVPFHMSDVHGGFSTAEGLLRFVGDALVFEIQIKPLGMISAGIREVRVPLADIESVSLSDGWWGSNLLVRATRAVALADVPSNQVGQVTLRIKKPDRDAARVLVDAVAETMAAGAGIPAGFAGRPAVGAAAYAAGHAGWHGEAPRELPPAMRRLVRPREDRIIKGVCSGLARYFHLEPVVVRLIFVVLAFLTGVFPVVIAYIVLALCISSESDPSVVRPPRPYRLMRLTDDRVWAGVCGGWAAYMGIEPVGIRLLYAVVTILTGIVPGLLLYIAMIFIMPVATLAEVPVRPGQPRPPSRGGMRRFGQLLGRFILSALVGGGVGALTAGILCGIGGPWDDEVAALIGVGTGLFSCGALWTGFCRKLPAPHRVWPALATIFIAVGVGLAVGGLTVAQGIGGRNRWDVAPFAGVGSGLLSAAIVGFILFTSLGTPLRWRWFFVVVFLGVGIGLWMGGVGVLLNVKEEVAVATGIGTGLLTAGLLTGLLVFGNLGTRLSGLKPAPANDIAPDPKITQTYYSPRLVQSFPHVAGGTVLLSVVALAMAAGLGAFWLNGDVPSLDMLFVHQPSPILVDAEVHRFIGHRSWIKALAFNHDGTRLVSGSDDSTVRLWDLTTRTELRQLSGHTRGINSVTFSPDGTKIAAAADCKDVRVWDTETGQELSKSIDHPGEVHAVAFNHDGTLLATGSTDDIVRLLDAETGQQVRPFFGCKNSIRSVAISPNGQTLAAVDGHYDNQVRTWDVASGRPGQTFQVRGSWPTTVAFSPNGREIAVREQSGRVQLWDLASGKEMQWTDSSSTDSITLAFGPEGQQVVTADYEGVKLRDTRTGRLIARFGRQHHNTPSAVAFSPVGLFIASGHHDGTIRLWEVPDSIRKPALLVAPNEANDIGLDDLGTLPEADETIFFIETPAGEHPDPATEQEQLERN